MRIKRFFNFVVMALLALASITSCSGGDDMVEPIGPITPTDSTLNTKTLLVFMPWSGDSAPLTSWFWKNIADLKEDYDRWGADDESVIVFICTSGTKAVMFNIDDYTGHDQASLARYISYNEPDFTSAQGIAGILGDMKAMAPARTYSMTIGCHGMGWLPVGNTKGVKRLPAPPADDGFVPHWEFANANGIRTRYFGGSAGYRIDVSTLAQALEATNTRLEFVLFDDCYMSSVEVAYDLRHVTDYLIACPTEVMAEGMPYSSMGRYLLGDADYEKICTAFYAFYSAYPYPYGTIGITKCDELDSLAVLAKKINRQYAFNADTLYDVQRMDGYNPVIFYDYGDYVAHLCKDSALLRTFNEQLSKAVPYKAHTRKFYSAYFGGMAYDIKAYSGITTSEPSVSAQAATVEETAWYLATH